MDTHMCKHTHGDARDFADASAVVSATEFTQCLLLESNPYPSPPRPALVSATQFGLGPLVCATQFTHCLLLESNLYPSPSRPALVSTQFGLTPLVSATQFTHRMVPPYGQGG